jgi:putative transposase
VLAKHAEDCRIEYNTVRSHEAIAWSRPKKAHRGLVDPTIPTFRTIKTLPTT